MFIDFCGKALLPEWNNERVSARAGDEPDQGFPAFAAAQLEPDRDAAGGSGAAGGGGRCQRDAIGGGLRSESESRADLGQRSQAGHKM